MRIPHRCKETDWQIKSQRWQLRNLGLVGVLIRTFVLWKVPELTSTLPQYTPAQDQLAKTERATKNEKCWWDCQMAGCWFPRLWPLASVSHSTDNPFEA